MVGKHFWYFLAGIPAWAFVTAALFGLAVSTLLILASLPVWVVLAIWAAKKDSEL